KLNVSTFDCADHYLINKLNNTISEVNGFMEKYEFSMASSALYNFIWEDFANWYVEISKSHLLGEDEVLKLNRQVVLRNVLEDIIKMLHPFTPFVTDEIYKQFANVDSVMLTSWPKNYDISIDLNEVEKFKILKEIIVGIRNIRAENDIKPSLPLRVFVETKLELNDRDINLLMTIGRLKSVKITTNVDVEVISFVTNGTNVHIINDGIIDNDAKISGLQDQAKKLEAEIKRSIQMLSNENFVSRAPKDKLEGEIKKAKNYINQYITVCEMLNSFGCIMDASDLINQAKNIMKERL
ncbi:MAG: class I tRNA ligase family protein, partial [Mycoplasmatales bacterium]